MRLHGIQIDYEAAGVVRAETDQGFTEWFIAYRVSRNMQDHARRYHDAFFNTDFHVCFSIVLLVSIQ